MIRRTACILLACTVTATATDYYVSSVHRGASDTSEGTDPAAPWATFDKVKQEWGASIQPGDTVHLERGSVWTWTGGGYWTITQGGNATQGHMTIRGDDYGSGATPMLRKNGSTAWDDTFYITGAASYITLRDFIVDNGSAQGFAATGIFIGGPSQSATISNIRVLNMTFQNLGNKSSVYVSGIRVGAYNNRTVRDCLIEGNDVSMYTGHGLNHYSQKAGGTSLNRLEGIVWRNNRVHTPSANIYGSVGSGIHISFGGSNNLFEYNYVNGANPASSIFLMNSDGDETALIIRHNVVVNNPHMYGNALVVVADSAGAIGSHVDAAIYGNVLAGCGAAGISIESENLFSGDLKIYNNTLINNGNVYSGEIFIKENNDTLNLEIRNNIMLHSADTPAGINIRPGYNGTLTHSHNLYWHTAGDLWRGVVNDQRIGVEYNLETITSFEPTATAADPLFTDVNQLPTVVLNTTGATPTGLMPQTASPAIDQGVELDIAYANSINNATRPQAAGWDIGAYEVPGTPPVQPLPPSGLTATALSTSSIALTWQDNATDETAYLVQRSIAGGGFIQITALASGATAYTDLSLQEATAYAYRVLADRNGTSSDYSNEASATTLAARDESPPELVWASIVEPTRIMMEVNEPLQRTSATNVSNYLLPAPYRVNAISYDQTVLALSVSPAFADQVVYPLQVDGLLDLAGNPIAANTSTSMLFQVIDPTLVGWYTFENDASDQSGAGNDGIASGTVLTPNGYIGQACLFDAATDYVQVPFAAMNPLRGTIAMWIEPNSFAAAPQYAFGLSDQTAWSNTIQLYTDDAAGNLDLGIAGVHPQEAAITVLTPLNWYHLALTWENGTHRLYLNGTPLAQGTHAPMAAFNTFADIGNCGRTSARTQGFRGIIDDVRLYNRALRPAEVLGLATYIVVPLYPTEVAPPTRPPQ